MRYRFFSAAFTAITFLFFHSLAAQNTFPASGSVGIGTTSPLKLLHVKGAGAFGSHVTAANATRALNLADVNAVMRILRVHASNAPAVELISRMSADGPNVAYWDLYVQPSDKSFRIRDRIGSGLDRLTISNDGNVGIGTITPHYPFHVVNPASQHGIHVENAFWGNADQYGVYASSVNAPGYGYGVRGREAILVCTVRGKAVLIPVEVMGFMDTPQEHPVRVPGMVFMEIAMVAPVPMGYMARLPMPLPLMQPDTLMEPYGPERTTPSPTASSSRTYNP
jgi:hypothetical protein